jgi:hypothetical protein
MARPKRDPNRISWKDLKASDIANPIKDETTGTAILGGITFNASYAGKVWIGELTFADGATTNRGLKGETLEILEWTMLTKAREHMKALIDQIPTPAKKAPKIPKAPKAEKPAKTAKATTATKATKSPGKGKPALKAAA